MIFDRRAFLAMSAAVAAPSQLFAQTGSVLRPEDFGARGDGKTNDTRAFAALSLEVKRRGGGTISLGPGRTYVVGVQSNKGPAFAWTPLPIIELRGLTKPFQILGNGACLLCHPGLRFGAFDRKTGIPRHHAMPNLRIEEIASPYHAMIWIRDCRAPITISHIELDGNLDQLLIGGQYGDTGWQIPATGLLLEGNHRPEIVENVLSHHHGQDGAMIIGDPARSERSRISHFVSRYNARQGLSVTAGRGYDFEDCDFSHTGRSKISSAPGAGVDIEAEEKPIRDLSFARCRFIDNVGVGMVADSGDSAGAQFTDCTFVGTTTWSAWPLKPHFRFNGCTFVGAVVHPFPDKIDAARATKFIGCRFNDNPALSPTGKVYEGGSGGTPGPIVNMAESDNVLFDRCTFDVTRAALPWSWKATYRDCTMTQRSTATSMTKGKFLGRTAISGRVDLYGSMIVGNLTLNGRVVPPGPIGVAAW